jgi:hypothetical protein
MALALQTLAAGMLADSSLLDSSKQPSVVKCAHYVIYEVHIIGRSIIKGMRLQRSHERGRWGHSCPQPIQSKNPTKNLASPGAYFVPMIMLLKLI